MAVSRRAPGVHCQASGPNKPREELNPETCPFHSEAANNSSHLAFVFLKVLFEKCEARLNFKFEVRESRRFLYCPRFSNGKHCRNVANPNDALIAVRAFVPGARGVALVCGPYLSSEILIEMGQSSLLSDEDPGLQELN